MKHRGRLIGIIIILILVIICTITWSQGKLSAQRTANSISIIRLLWFAGLSTMINQLRLDDKLIVEDKLLQYPRYKLALAGIGVVGAMIIIDSPLDRLLMSFAIASIVLGRDHRRAAFGALSCLGVVIVMLILKQQSLADIYAIYLYYFLAIATVTMIVNNKGENLENLEDLGGKN